jgi:uncharacterized membrane protein YoaK (UPF0700 family)
MIAMSLSSVVFEADPEKNGSVVVTQSKRSRLIKHWRQDIRLKHSDIILLMCSFLSGLCDSGAFNAWSCFVCMQTGNTIFLGLGAAGLPISKPYGWLRSLIAILAFVVGCFVFSTSRNRNPRSRGTLATSFLVQGSCLVVAAVLVQAKVVPDAVKDSDSKMVLIPLVFLGFQAGGQVWTGDVLGFKEIPTTVLTSVYFGLASDVKFLQGLKTNLPRNRRLIAVCALLLGAVSGGWLSRSRGGIPSVFFVAAGLKFCISGIWMLWPAEEETESVP